MFDFTGHPLESLKVYSYIFRGATTDLEVSAVESVDITVTEGEDIVLPGTLTVTYNDRSSESLSVIWNADDLATANSGGVGIYTISGTMTIAGKSINVSAAVTVKMANLLTNPGYESGASGWTLTGNGISITNSDANPRTGSYALKFWYGSDFEYEAYQEITGLAPGIYNLEGYLEGDEDGEGDSLHMYVSVNGGKESTDSGIMSGWMNWDKLQIADITVSSGDSTIKVGVRSSLTAGAWGSWDDFYLYRTGDYTAPVPDEPGDPDDGSGDGGSGDVSPGDVNPGDVNPGDVSPGDVNPGNGGSDDGGDDGSSDNGSGDDGSDDNDSGDNGSGNEGSGDDVSGDSGSGDSGSDNTTDSGNTNQSSGNVFQPVSANGQPDVTGKVAVYSEVILSDGRTAQVVLQELPAETKTHALTYASEQGITDPVFTQVDVSVVGYQQGTPITITFNLHNVLAGDSLVILHQKQDGTWETIIPDKVEDGKVTVSFTSLSPVAFIKLSNATTTSAIKAPKTADTNWQAGMIWGISALALGCYILVWQKKKKNNR
jgi:LPXTG-motif cell wall-anchored protein